MAPRSSESPRGRIWLLLSVAWMAGCHACSDSRFVAELLQADKAVDRDFGSAVNLWTKAEKGARFEMGDGLRTGAAASAQLGLPRGGRLLLKSDTVMRFMRELQSGAAGRGIDVQQGELTIETGELEIGINTPEGVVRLTPASQVLVRANADKIHFDVIVGRAEYAQHGKPLVAEAGRGFDIEVLSASAEITKAPAPAAPENAAGSPALDIPPTAAEVARSGRNLGPLLRDLQFQEPPQTTTFSLPAGETATVHDPSPPTDLRIIVSACPALAVLEFDRGNGRYDAVRARGTGDIRARVPTGALRYRVRCVKNARVENPPVSTGRLSIVRDAATRPLPSKPVSITADADGRRYTVSFQNRLPVITLRWPEAPATPSYLLSVTPERGPAFTVQASQPSVTLAAGRLSEGLHGFQFAGANKRSEQGLLRVAFDYKARTAYLTSPMEGQPWQSDATRFAGGTLLGSTVHVNGLATKLDSQGRFAADLPVQPGTRALAVRVQHPSTGIHYYVRHMSGGEEQRVAAP